MQQYPLDGHRDAIVAARISGESVASLAKRHCVSRQAIYNVLHAAEQQGASVPWQKKSRLPQTCRSCGRQFLPDKTPNRKTCSPECLKAQQRKSQQSRRKGAVWSRNEFVSLTCRRCSREFQRTKYVQAIGLRNCGPGKSDFCSRSCSNKFRAASRLTSSPMPTMIGHE